VPLGVGVLDGDRTSSRPSTSRARFFVPLLIGILASLRADPLVDWLALLRIAARGRRGRGAGSARGRRVVGETYFAG
jgi:hypothetical protein